MAEHIRRAMAKSKRTAMQVIPKQVATVWHEILRQFHCQWPVTGGGHDLVGGWLMTKQVFSDRSGRPEPKNWQ